MTTTGAVPAVVARPRAAIGQRTLRRDRWWVAPALTVIGLLGWLAYATTRVFSQANYYVAEHHYLTPFYSPCTSTGCLPEAAHFGRFTPDHPLIPYAALSLPFLLLFRLTCYYYRKAYYRSFWLSPPACAVPDKRPRYSGETRFPLVFQNLHRYAFYAAVLISLVNTYDAIIAFDGERGLGIGLGNLVLAGNVVMLWIYTLSCHSCRHVFAGRLRNFSRHPVRYRWWLLVSKLNTRHMEWAWITLGTLALTDAYVMSVSAGWITDLRFVN
ncbi:MAG: hypothetical protein ACRDT2_11045 [Natronosporangium sp.]